MITCGARLSPLASFDVYILQYSQKHKKSVKLSLYLIFYDALFLLEHTFHFSPAAVGDTPESVFFAQFNTFSRFIIIPLATSYLLY